MGSDNFVDPYIDPGTGVLRNLVGARDLESLAAIEADLVYPRALGIFHDYPVPTGDLAELRAIHRYLFRKLFDWAGELRIVDIRKSEGGEFFLPVSMIERAAAFASEELRADSMLKDLSRDEFVRRLAYHYDQVNAGGSTFFAGELFVTQANAVGANLPPRDSVGNPANYNSAHLRGRGHRRQEPVTSSRFLLSQSRCHFQESAAQISTLVCAALVRPNGEHLAGH